jgi:hypothetical protein
MRLDDLLELATQDGIRSRYGDRWLEALPAIVRIESGRHGLEVQEVLGGGRTACVLRVSSPQGPAVLKIAPDVTRSRREEEALVRLAGVGIAPDVLYAAASEEQDARYHAMIIGLIPAGRNLREASPLTILPERLAQALSRVRDAGRLPLTQPLERIEVHLQSHLERVVSGDRVRQQAIPPIDMAEVQGILDSLAAEGPALTWVHGTMHPGNLVASNEESLLVVDPRPFLSHPDYDFAESTLKLGSELAGRPHNLEDGMRFAEETARHLPVDLERIRVWMTVLLASGV